MAVRVDELRGRHEVGRSVSSRRLQLQRGANGERDAAAGGNGQAGVAEAGVRHRRVQPAVGVEGQSRAAVVVDAFA